ncbi:MAG TPA: Arm DNA-binding domain-containing protein [Planktothrix sp.]
MEEKNGSVVRRLVGYQRFEGRKALAIMAELYTTSRLYINYFQPSMKLVKKTRIGAKVTKEYDTAKTPLERLTRAKTLSKTQKNVLLSEFRALDPLKLLAEMNRLQTKLWQVHLGPAQEPVVEGLSKETKQTDRYTIPKRASKQNKRAKPERTRQQDDLYARLILTQDFVDNVEHSASGKNIHRDKMLIGFGLRVNPNTKSFLVEARVNGIGRRITIGRADLFSVEEARDEACRLLRQMKRGIEPLRLRKR